MWINPGKGHTFESFSEAKANFDQDPRAPAFARACATLAQGRPIRELRHTATCLPSGVDPVTVHVWTRHASIGQRGRHSRHEQKGTVVDALLLAHIA